MDLLDSYGHWTGYGETPASVVALASSVHSSVGGFNIEGVMRNIQTNGLAIGDGYTVDTFLSALRNATGGGHLVPELNLDIYTVNQMAGSPTAYCNPDNLTDCGPRFFYETSSEYLSLSAIASDPGRTVLIDSWDTFARNTTAYPLAAAIFQNLTNAGWAHIITKQIGPQYLAPPGIVSGQVANVQYQPESPYMVPETSMLSQMPGGEIHLLYFDRQNKENPNAETSLQNFLSTLSPADQLTSLANLASQQGPGGYVFEFPVLTYTRYIGNYYSWDAQTASVNGQTFLQVIESLILQNG